MKERLPQIVLILGTILLILTSAKACVKSVFLFGDSQFDPGNNPYIKNCTVQAIFPPYGSSYFQQPTGRFSDGRTVADFIAQFLGVEFQIPFQEFANGNQSDFPANGMNFASGGSGLLAVTNREEGVTAIGAQLQQFRTLIDEKRIDNIQIENSLYFIESGSNDILNYFLVGDTFDTRTYVQTMMDEVDSFTSTIYKLGARRIALFSVGPMGCVPARINLPGASTTECFDMLNKMSEDFNTGLERLANNISEKYHGAIGVYGALYDIVQKIRKNPNLHGFANANDACCGSGTLNARLQCGLEGYNVCSNRSEFFFWDYVHPSERAYGLISSDLWPGSKDQIRPINIKTLACTATP